MKLRPDFPDITKKYLRKARKIWYLPLILVSVLTAVFSVPCEKISQWHRSTVVTDLRGSPSSGISFKNEEWALPISLEEMGTWMPKVVVALEDRRFFHHPGADLTSLSRAMVQNMRAGKVISGGSTITTQLIRLSVPRERTLRNKVLEFWQAVQLERLMTKNEILEFYLKTKLRLVPTSGCRSSGQGMVQQTCKRTIPEAAILTGLLRGPAFYCPDRHPQRVPGTKGPSPRQAWGTWPLPLMRSEGLSLNLSRQNAFLYPPHAGKPRRMPRLRGLPPDLVTDTDA